jgi:putative methylase
VKRRELEVLLQRVRPHPRPRPGWEQYATPAPVAAEVLYFALGRGDIEGRRVVDAGTGTGILAIGAKLLGARVVVGYDIDEVALGVARENAAALGVDVLWIRAEAASFVVPADTVVQNPPFGAQRRGADRPFLEAALRCAPVAYSFHKAETEAFVRRLVEARGGRVTDTLSVPFSLPHAFPFHRKVAKDVPVVLLRIEGPLAGNL